MTLISPLKSKFTPGGRAARYAGHRPSPAPSPAAGRTCGEVSLPGLGKSWPPHAEKKKKMHISGTETVSIPPDLSPRGGMGDAPAGTDFGTRGGSPGRGEATLLVIIVTIIAVAVEVAIAQSCRRQQGDGCLAAGMQGESGERSSFQDSKTKYRATQENGGKKGRREKSSGVLHSGVNEDHIMDLCCCCC